MFEFKDHEGEPVGINPAHVMMVRPHRCNRHDARNHMTDVIFTNGSRTPVVGKFSEVYEILGGLVRVT